MGDKNLFIKISLIVISIFITTFFIYQKHNGFRKSDYLLIPVFSLIIFLILDLSTKSIFQNLESFTIENYENADDVRQLDQVVNNEPIDSPQTDPQLNPPTDISTNQNIDQNTMMTENETMDTEQVDSVDDMGLTENNEVKRYPTSPIVRYQDKKQRQILRKNGTRPDINDLQMSDGLDDQANKNLDSMLPININVSYNNNQPNTLTDQKFTGLPFNNQNNPNQNIPNQNNPKEIIREIVKESAPASATAFVAQPNFVSQLIDFMKLANAMNIDKYRFDSGLDDQKKKDSASTETLSRPTLMNPVNSFTQNATLSNLNQSYYPAYLQNPLNKDLPGTHIDSVFDNNKRLEETLKKQIDKNEQANPNILLRKDITYENLNQQKNTPVVNNTNTNTNPNTNTTTNNNKPPVKQEPMPRESSKQIIKYEKVNKEDEKKELDEYRKNVKNNVNNTFDWMASNYEAHMLKKILTEKNDPAPVLLEQPWSEWKPLE